MGGNLGTALGGWKGHAQFTGSPPFCGRGPEAHRGHVKAPEVTGGSGASQGRENSLLCRVRGSVRARRWAVTASLSHSLSGDAEPNNELAERCGSGSWNHPPHCWLPYRSRLLVWLFWRS